MLKVRPNVVPPRMLDPKTYAESQDATKSFTFVHPKRDKFAIGTLDWAKREAKKAKTKAEAKATVVKIAANPVAVAAEEASGARGSSTVETAEEPGEAAEEEPHYDDSSSTDEASWNWAGLGWF